MLTENKPIIGFTSGDINGIGIEIFLKAFSDNRMFDHCIPVFFGSNKLMNFYKKAVANAQVNYQQIRDFQRLNPRQVNLFNCWEEEINVQPGQLNNEGGSYAIKSLLKATESLKAGEIDGMVTAPIHKNNTQSSEFSYTGHTPFLKSTFEVKDVVMMLCAGDFRVALVTEHVPVKDIASHITVENILQKLIIICKSLYKDFGIERPRIAVLGLNPHAGDGGLVGDEEEKIIKPAIREAKNKNMLVSGPYSADAFFARNHQKNFDAVLAMYHDQGLIPFKALATGDGVNYTAGLPVVRTSPDHGVAFDIAGKDQADPSSFISSVFTCIDIIRQRSSFDEMRQNPLKKINSEVFARMEDEEIRE